jgi:hypothetical protein
LPGTKQKRRQLSRQGDGKVQNQFPSTEEGQLPADTSAEEQSVSTFRLPLALLDRLRAVARAHDRSLSAELRVAIRDHVHSAELEEQRR